MAQSGQSADSKVSPPAQQQGSAVPLHKVALSKDEWPLGPLGGPLVRQSVEAKATAPVSNSGADVKDKPPTVVIKDGKIVDYGSFSRQPAPTKTFTATKRIGASGGDTVQAAADSKASLEVKPETDKQAGKDKQPLNACDDIAVPSLPVEKWPNRPFMFCQSSRVASSQHAGAGFGGQDVRAAAHQQQAECAL